MVLQPEVVPGKEMNHNSGTMRATRKPVGGRSRGEAPGHGIVSDTQGTTRHSIWLELRMGGGLLGDVDVCQIVGAKLRNSD